MDTSRINGALTYLKYQSLTKTVPRRGWKNGDKIVTMRYRYDEASHWTPTSMTDKAAENMTDRLGIQVAGYETNIRNQVKRAGGIRRPRQQSWKLSDSQILKLGLESRTVSIDENRGD